MYSVNETIANTGMTVEDIRDLILSFVKEVNGCKLEVAVKGMEKVGVDKAMVVQLVEEMTSKRLLQYVTFSTPGCELATFLFPGNAKLTLSVWSDQLYGIYT